MANEPAVQTTVENKAEFTKAVDPNTPIPSPGRFEALTAAAEARYGKGASPRLLFPELR